MAFLGQESVDAAIAARCADRQGKFWQYKHLLFANQGGRQSGAFAWSRLAEFASSLHVDIQQFTACANDRSILDAVSSETAQAYARHVKETPTLMVNGVTVMAVNDWPSVSAAIEAVLAPDAASRR
jgi:protein-disulfide isomerase